MISVGYEQVVGGAIVFNGVENAVNYRNMLFFHQLNKKGWNNAALTRGNIDRNYVLRHALPSRL